MGRLKESSPVILLLLLGLLLHQSLSQYLTPFVERERYQIPNKCRLHPDNDLYRDQEQHKVHVDIYEWKCGYCRKSFNEEKFLDQHFDTRHYNLLNTTGTKCFADLCGALHCDSVLSSSKKGKSKCNPAAAAKNRHLCENTFYDNSVMLIPALEKTNRFLEEAREKRTATQVLRRITKTGKKTKPS
ncbi:hypothetical protein Bca101_063592 [Brassica carinata]